VWYTYANKHWDGVLAWINGHRSQREDIRGRILDLIVYLILLWAMVDDENDNALMAQDVATMTDPEERMVEEAVTFLINKGFAVGKRVEG
jgi:hypothetical protein